MEKRDKNMIKRIELVGKAKEMRKRIRRREERKEEKENE